jgi:hypothetical protein
MTWAEFKLWIEAQGVKDGDRIRAMDFHSAPESVRYFQDDPLGPAEFLVL